MNAPPRYVPQRQLPPYAYVPGLFPHPISDPEGHMYGKQADKPLQAESEVRFGFDLFNHGYYWEAHEAWEQGWAAAGRSGAYADVLKGLIKLAAAGVKARQGKPQGVRRHARRAQALLLASAAADENDLPPQWKAQCDGWAKHAAEVAAAADDLIDTSTDEVVIVFPFRLKIFP